MSTPFVYVRKRKYSLWYSVKSSPARYVLGKYCKYIRYTAGYVIMAWVVFICAPCRKRAYCERGFYMPRRRIKMRATTRMKEH